MKPFDSNKIKNVAILGHAGSGKTTMVEAMLFEAGIINRRGTVEEGNTVSDYHDIEKQRGNSIFSTLLHLQWKDNKINLIDTPGFDDFVGEVISSLRVADTAIMVLNAQNGVEVGTELIWEYTENYQTPMIFAINHTDHEKADFDKTLEQAKQRFGEKVVPVQYPYNQGTGFNAIIDVLKMVMYVFPPQGGKPEKKPIPDSETDKANEMHNALIEAIAVNDEGLMELFFEKGTLDEEEMAKGMKHSMINHDIFPVFCCSAKSDMGTGRILGFIHDIAPSAMDVPPVQRQSGKSLQCKPDGPVCLFVFKTISEPHLGDMSFFKVYSGEVKNGADLVNSLNENTERLNQLFILNGRNREQVNVLKAGDIGATVKLKNTATNSTLYEKGSPVHITPIQFPAPRITVAVSIDNKADVEKLSHALHVLHAEDPTLIVEHSKELGQILLSGQGELHLAVAKWKAENLHKIKFEYIEPKIPFRETIRKPVRSNYRHKKQSGGAGQFGEVHMLVEPYYEGMPAPEGMSVRTTEEVNLEWGGKLVFNNCIVGGAIDAKYMSAIMKGVMDKMTDGPLTGSYVRDVRVSIYDGKMHPVDSNDMAFKIAGTMAFKQAFQEANPLILEPLYDVEVLVAEDAMGDVMGDLQTRRAMIMGIESEGHYQKIKARVPLMELYKYSSTLRSLTQGRAKHSQYFSEFTPVPGDIQQQLIDKHQKELQEA
ncbi:MAG: elongation factor G [Sphingobacteriales bacterium]|nr:MAG: elongation factor G [Sphingobacteriales bacterium]